MQCVQEIWEQREESYILPFLWLKGESLETIKEEMERIEECNIKQICLESRPHPDFLGEKWWETLDFILEEARKRNMKVWILDDDKFPTGHSHGAYEEKYPEYSKLYLAERHMDIMGPCEDSAVLVENFLGDDGELLGILACPKPDGKTLDVESEYIINLTDCCKDGFVYFDLPPGAYRLFVFFTTRKGGGRPNYMNLIDSRSVKVLIDTVYESHYEHYAKYFGNTIAGFFSDEPELGNHLGYPFDLTLGLANEKLPWSEELSEKLHTLWGEKFLENLPALWYGYGEPTARLRSEYMDELTKLVYTCFSGQISQWCKAHQVEYIGHVIEDDNAHTRLGCSVGHYFREMKGQHMAGIDVVHHQIVPGFTEKIHQWIAGDSDGEFFHFGLAKLASSAAHIQAEKKGRALCEIFGNYGWAEGVSLMKWLTNHMLVRGINHFTPHAFSMKYPDFDCPPHFYARGNNPQFACFAQLMKYMNRACHLLSGGVHQAQALVLYHAESEWASGETMFFQKPVRELMENQMDCDVICVDDLEKVQFADETLHLNQESYDTFIIPYCEYIHPTVVDFVIRLAEKGKKSIVLEKFPVADTNGKELPYEFFKAVEIVPLKHLGEACEKQGKREVIFYSSHKDLRAFVVKKEEKLILMLFNENVSDAIETKVNPSDSEYTMATSLDLWGLKKESFYLNEEGIQIYLDAGEAQFFVIEKEKTIKKRQLRCIDCRDITTDWRVSRRGIHQEKYEDICEIRYEEKLPNMNGRQKDPSFVGTYRYEGKFDFIKYRSGSYYLRILEAGDSVRVFLNQKEIGYMAGFPSQIEITDELEDGMNQITIEVMTTNVWEVKDGASTHLQLYATGLRAWPQICRFK